MQKRHYLLVGSFAMYLSVHAIAATPKFDFDGNGSGDLAIGAPAADVNGKRAAGIVTVIYGKSGGLQPSKETETWDLDRSDVPGSAYAGDYFGFSLAGGDFNNDGYTDLAIGVRSNNNPSLYGHFRVGSVVVLYGSPGGLLGTHTLCSIPCAPQPKTFTLPSGHAGDYFGAALVAAKFDPDEYVDLAIGAPLADVDGVSEAGAVMVLKGSGSGLTTTGKQVFDLNTDLSGAPDQGDQFGWALAAGEFGKTAALDLAIGIPGKEDYGGAVTVIYGGQFGLSPVAEPAPFGGGGNTLWRQNVTAFPDWSPNDRFGASLAAANFGNSGYDDLAIGIPLKTIAGVTQCGAVTALYGSGTGLSNNDGQQWGFHNLPGTPLDYDFFGASVAAGNLGYNGYADLAIGVPNHDVSGQNNAGVVTVVFGTSSGLAATNAMNLYSPTALPGDKFGSAVSVAQYGSDSYADLAIGIPYYGDGGAVSVRNGTSTGPHTTASTNGFWSAEGSFPGVFSADAWFGQALSE